MRILYILLIMLVSSIPLYADGLLEWAYQQVSPVNTRYISVERLMRKDNFYIAAEQNKYTIFNSKGIPVFNSNITGIRIKKVIALQNGGYAIIGFSGSSPSCTLSAQLFNDKNHPLRTVDIATGLTEYDFSAFIIENRYFAVVWYETDHYCYFRIYDIFGVPVYHDKQIAASNVDQPDLFGGFLARPFEDGFVMVFSNSGVLYAKVLPQLGKTVVPYVSWAETIPMGMFFVADIVTNNNKFAVVYSKSPILIDFPSPLLIKSFTYNKNVNLISVVAGAPVLGTYIKINGIRAKYRDGVYVFFNAKDCTVSGLTDNDYGLFGMKAKSDTDIQNIQAGDVFNVSAHEKAGVPYTNKKQGVSSVVYDDFIRVFYYSEEQAAGNDAMYMATYGYDVKPDYWFRFDDLTHVIHMNKIGIVDVYDDSYSELSGDKCIKITGGASGSEITYDFVDRGEQITVKPDTLFVTQFKAPDQTNQYFGIKFIFQDGRISTYMYNRGGTYTYDAEHEIVIKRSLYPAYEWVTFKQTLGADYLTHPGVMTPKLPVRLDKIILFSSPGALPFLVDNIQLYNVDVGSLGSVPQTPVVKAYFNNAELVSPQTVKPGDLVTLWAEVNDDNTYDADMQNCTFSVKTGGSLSWNIMTVPAVFDDTGSPDGSGTGHNRGLCWRKDIIVPENTESLDVMFSYSDVDGFTAEQTEDDIIRISGEPYFLTVHDIETYVNGRRVDEPRESIMAGETITLYTRISDRSMESTEKELSDDFSTGAIDSSKWDKIKLSGHDVKTVGSDGISAPCLLTDCKQTYTAWLISKQTFNYTGKILEISANLRHGNAPIPDFKDQRKAQMGLYKKVTTGYPDISEIVELRVKGNDHPTGPAVVGYLIYDDNGVEKVEKFDYGISDGDGWHKGKIKIREDGHVEFFIDSMLFYTSEHTVIGDYDGSAYAGFGGRKSYYDNIVIKQIKPADLSLLSNCLFSARNHNNISWDVFEDVSAVYGNCPLSSDPTSGWQYSYTIPSGAVYEKYDVWFSAQNPSSQSAELESPNEVIVGTVTENGEVRYARIEGARYGVVLDNTAMNISSGFFKRCGTAVTVIGDSQGFLRYNKFAGNTVDLNAEKSLNPVDARYNWFGSNNQPAPATNAVNVPWAYWGSAGTDNGHITSDETWTLANSPTVILGTVEVEAGVKLSTEMGGMMLKFLPGTSLVVKGSLWTLAPNSTNPVRYTSLNNDSGEAFFLSSGNPKPGDFGGIKFIAGNTPGSYQWNMKHAVLDYSNGMSFENDGSCSITDMNNYTIGISYTTVVDTDKNAFFFSGITFDATGASLGYLTVRNAGQSALFAENAMVPYIKNFYSSNTASGIILRNAGIVNGGNGSILYFNIDSSGPGIAASSPPGSMKFESGTIENCLVGIEITNCSQTMNFTDVGIVDCLENGLSLSGSSFMSSINISRLKRNGQAGLHLSGSGIFLSATSSKFSGNLTGIDIPEAGTVMIKNCAVSENTKGMMLKTASLAIEENTVSYNKAEGIFCEDCTGTLFFNTVEYNGVDGIAIRATAGNTGSPSVDKNTVTKNSKSGISIHACDADVRYNVTTGNSDGIELIDIENSFSSSIEHNTCSENRMNGLRIENSDIDTIFYNKVENNGETGIFLMQAEAALIEENLISGGTNGIASEGYLNGNNQLWKNNHFINSTEKCVLVSNGKNITLSGDTALTNLASYPLFGELPSINNAAEGIAFSNTRNSIIRDYNFSLLGNQGIMLSSSNSIIIENCSISDSGGGIRLESSGTGVASGSEIMIRDNSIKSNSSFGIHCLASKAEISSNIITDNTGVGISFENEWFGDDNCIYGNDIFDNAKGSQWGEEIVWQWIKQDSGLELDGDIKDSCFSVHDGNVRGFFCGDNGIILEAVNNGQMLRQIMLEGITNQKDISFSAIAEQNGNLFIGGREGNIAKIYRYPGNFTPETFGQTINDLESADDGRIYAVGRSTFGSGIIKYFNGVSWINVTGISLPALSVFTSITMVSSDKGFLTAAASSSNPKLYSFYPYNTSPSPVISAQTVKNTSGTNLSNSSIPNLNSVCAYNDSMLVATGNSGFIAQSFDSGATWKQKIMSGITADLESTNGLSSGRGIIAGKSGTLLVGTPVIGKKPLIEEFYASGYRIGPNCDFAFYWNVENPAGTGALNIAVSLQSPTGSWSALNIVPDQNNPNGEKIRAASTPGMYTLELSASNDEGISKRRFRISIEKNFMSEVYVSKNAANTLELGTIDYPVHSLAKGRDLAASGGVIHFAEGEYSETVVFSLPVHIIGGYSDDFSSRDFTSYTPKLSGNGHTYGIEFGSGANSSVIEDVHFYRCGVKLNNVSSVALKSISVDGNNVSSYVSKGAGIYADNADNLVLENCIIENCSANDTGGGLYLKDSSNTSISKLTVKNCYANEGGGVSFENSTGSFYSNSISNCSSHNGGGIYDTDSDIYCYFNRIYKNTVSYSGALSGNGGGALLYNTNSRYYNNVFSENTSALSGGGLYMYRFFYWSGRDLINNVFYRNTGTVASAVLDGFALPFPPPAKYVKNCVFYDVPPAIENYSGYLDGGGNQAGDPLFTNAANGDFSIQAGSSAANNGIDVGLDHNGAVAGNWNGSAPDIGALESDIVAAVVAGIYVDDSIGNDSTGSGTKVSPYNSVAKALSVANSGDTIFVAEGSYSEPINYINANNLIIQGGYQSGDWNIRDYKIHATTIQPSGSITLSGQGTIVFEGVVLSGNGNHRTIKIDDSGNYMFKHCKIINGNLNSAAPAPQDGAGIYYTGTGKLTIENCHFEGNHTYHRGGAISCSGKTEIKYTLFKSNASDTDGGGIHVINNSDFKMSYSILRDNTAPSIPNSGDGGGIFFEGTSTGNLNHCTFFEDVAQDKGNEIRCGLGNFNVLVQNSAIYNSNANIHFERVGTSTGTLTLNYCTGMADNTLNVIMNNTNLNDNPKFNPDLTLQSGSPCIGTAQDSSDRGAIPYNGDPTSVGW